MRKTASILIVCCCAVLLAHSARAAAAAGSIRLHLACGGKPVGGTLILYRVGEITAETPVYTLCGAFRGSGADLTRYSDPETAARLADYAREQNLTGEIEEADAAGNICFAPLETGLYLIAQRQCSPGYAPVQPFLVTVPLTVGDQVYDDIDASPKVALRPELPQTGQCNLPIPLLGAAGVMLCCAGWMLHSAGRRRDGK